MTPGSCPRSASRRCSSASSPSSSAGYETSCLARIVGATCLGLLTAFAGFFFPEWITFTIFLIMIVLIIVRPQGMVG